MRGPPCATAPRLCALANKAFYGASLNAVSTQVWIAISVHVLVAVVRKRLGLDGDLYTLLQILSTHPQATPFGGGS